MADPAGAADPPWQRLLDHLAGELVRDYRIDRDGALAALAEVLRHDHALRAAVAEEPDLERLLRRRICRDARQRARKAVYYQLRRYRPSSPAEDEAPAAGLDVLLASHASTRERLPWREGFDAVVGPLLAESRRVVDVGCGLYPLMAPWPAAPGLERYVALDRDPAAIAALQGFAAAREPRLDARLWSAEQGWVLDGDEPFDLALLLKVVPVVARQEPEQLATLARVPARRMLLSGSRVALAKRQDIERRERQILRRFLAQHGLISMGEWVVGEEILLLAQGRKAAILG